MDFRVERISDSEFVFGFFFDKRILQLLLFKKGAERIRISDFAKFYFFEKVLNGFWFRILQTFTFLKKCWTDFDFGFCKLLLFLKSAERILISDFVDFYFWKCRILEELRIPEGGGGG